MMRSLLFVPGDSERKMAKAAGAGADALILDLEDSVSQSRKPMPVRPWHRFSTLPTGAQARLG
jgi:citrate lyase beta subunit